MKWHKHIATWRKDDSLAPSLEYDNPRQEFILRVGNEEIDIPREAIDDLLSLAGWRVLQSTEVERVLSALHELQEDAALYREALETLRAPGKGRRGEPGTAWGWRSGMNKTARQEKLLGEVYTVWSRDQEYMEALEKKAKELEAIIAGQKRDMGNIIGSAQKEINRLKEKAGEK